jgi:mono/diheme cytochrome c family protein
MKYALLPIISLTAILYGCNARQLEAPTPPPVVQPVPDNWLQAQKSRRDAKTAYIKQHKVAYDWFANFPFSESDGTPYLLLRLLPVIAPEYWGSEKNFLDVVGLFMDERQPGYPVARGIGISVLARQDPLGDIDYASFTCAACHIGRVRTGEGRLDYLDGGVNTEFNIVLYRVKVHQTLQKIYGQEKDPEKKQKLSIDAFLQALQVTHEKNKTFFYKDYKSDGMRLDAVFEEKQIALFNRNAAATIAKFVIRSEAEYAGYAALLDKNYKGFESESLKGFPGMADATGISVVNGYIDAQESFFGRLFSYFILPSRPGITDFMSVWEQDKRRAQWDKHKTSLINGGGQWNGNIPIPMYRNLAAQLTLGLENNDIRVSAFGAELLAGLPASVYPFDVDVQLAGKGKTLFTENCAQCHQPQNGKVYANLGTNPDRSYVVNSLIRQAAIRGFNKVCTPATSVDMAGKEVQPCAEFDGVSLEGRKSIIMSPNNQHHGYNARPLSGIWAQAPYLHNGSVPTIHHLLVPNERPATFIKSRLDYDKNLLGFSWKPSSSAASNAQEGYLFDTKSFPAFSNAGHDKDIKDGSRTYKLDWSDDIDGAKAIIEYLKTL